MKFGEVWDIKVPEGIITVMTLAPSPNPYMADAGVWSAVTLKGWTNFVGSAGYPPGLYGPGSIGPVKFNGSYDNRRDDA